jgi:hypothetical protein
MESATAKKYNTNSAHIVTGINDSVKEALKEILITNVTELLTVNEYWKQELQNGSIEVKEQAKAEIAKIQAILIAKSTLTFDVLNASEIGSNPIVETTQTSVTDEKEVKVFDINTKKEVIKEDAKESRFKIDVTEQPKPESKEILTEIGELLTTKDISKRCIVLIQEGKKEEANLFASDLLTKGNYLPKEGKNTHNWKESEFNSWFKDLLERSNNQKETIKTTSDTKTEDVVLESTELSEEDRLKTVNEVLDSIKQTVIEKITSEETKQLTLDFISVSVGDIITKEEVLKFYDEILVSIRSELIQKDKALEEQGIDKESIKIYQKHYGNDKVVLDFSKPKSDPAQEEQAFIELAEMLLKLKEENKNNDREINALLCIFFLDPGVYENGRGYSNFQRQAWWNMTQLAKAPLKGNLLVIKNLKPDVQKNIPIDETKTDTKVDEKVNNIGDLFEKGKELIEVKKTSQESLFEWFKSQVLNRTIKGLKEIIDSESAAKRWFEQMFIHFFRKEENSKSNEETGNLLKQTTEEIIRLLQNASKEDTVSTITKKAKEFSTKINSNISLTELMKQVKSLSKEFNPTLHEKFSKNTQEVKLNVGVPKEEDVKVEIKEKIISEKVETPIVNKFDIKDWKNTMVNVSFFETNQLKDYVLKINEIEKECHSDKGKEIAFEFIKKIINEGRAGSYFTKPISIRSESNPKTVETKFVTFTDEELKQWINEVLTPKSDNGIVKDAIIVEETKNEIPSVDTATNDSIAIEPEIIPSNEKPIDFSELSDAQDRKQFESALGKLLLEHKEKKTLNSEIIKALKVSRGKYSRKIGKNKEGDIHRTINNISNNIETLQTT